MYLRETYTVGEWLLVWRMETLVSQENAGKSRISDQTMTYNTHVSAMYTLSYYYYASPSSY